MNLRALMDERHRRNANCTEVSETHCSFHCLSCCTARQISGTYCTKCIWDLFPKFSNNEKGITGDVGMSVWIISLSIPAGILFLSAF